MKKISILSLLFFLAGITCALAGQNTPFETIENRPSETKTVKILAIGNSFSEDAIEQHLHELAAAEGITTIIGNLYIAGCPLERHYNNSVNNTADYAYRKIAADGTKTGTPHTTLEKALADEQWDYISLQQASQLSGMYDSYNPFLDNLIRYVKERAKPGVKLIWHQTWAYARNSTHSGFANYSNDQTAMYRAIVKTSEKAFKKHGFDILVPCGTAIQNARTTFIGDNMNRDGYHLNMEYGRYTAACTWLEAVLGDNPETNGYAPEGMTDSIKTATRMAAHAACRQPYKVTDLGKACHEE